MDNITYFNEIAQQETGGEIPKLAQDGMTEDYHEYRQALSNHISMIPMSEADNDVLLYLISQVANAAYQSGYIKGFLTSNDS